MKLGKLMQFIALLALAPSLVLAAESVDESWDLDADATVTIENVAGGIVIQGWGKSQARLTGSLGDSVDELEISASGSSLNIEVVNRNERNVDDTLLKIMVPDSVSIMTSAVSADIHISDMENGKITASSVSGEVEVDATSSWVSIESISGDVSFSGRTARISAESVSGDIDLSGISGEVTVSTVSGDMELQAGVVESAKLESVSGDTTAELEVAANGRLTSESMSGDVVIRLPASQSGLFRAQSFSGSISSDFGSVSKSRHGPGRQLRHSAGDNGAEIRIESFSGDIKLRSD